MTKGFIKNVVATVLGLTVLLAANGVSALTLPSFPSPIIPSFPSVTPTPIPTPVLPKVVNVSVKTSNVNSGFAYVNMYAVTPVTNGVYSGKLISTKQQVNATPVTFAVMPGQMVDFVTFGDDIAKYINHWTFTTPPYKNFGFDGNFVCKIDYLNSNDKLVLSVGGNDCTNSFTLDTSDKFVSDTVFPDATRYVRADTVADMEVSVLESGYAVNRVKNAEVNLYDYESNKLIGKVNTGERGIVTFVLRRGQKFYFFATKNGMNYGGYKTKDAPTPRVFYVTQDGEKIKNEFDGLESDVLRLGAYPNTERLLNDLLIILPVQIGTPSIVSPYANQILTNLPRNAYISWTAVTNATRYEVRVEWFNGVNWVDESNYSITGGTNFTTDPLIGDKKFRVRVRAVTPFGVGAWSSDRYFSYSTQVLTPVVTDAPVITEPTQYQIVTNDDNFVVIKWNPVNHAQKFEAWLDIQAAGGWTTMQRMPPTTNMSWGTGNILTDKKTYRVSVRGISSTGALGPVAERIFTYEKTAVVGTPTIKYPAQNGTVTNKTIRVTWDAGIHNEKFNFEYECKVDSRWVLCGNANTVHQYQDVLLNTVTANHHRVRVQGQMFNGTKGLWSEYRYFYFSEVSVVTTAPVISSPRGGQYVNNPVTINWNTVSHAVRYNLLINKAVNGSFTLSSTPTVAQNYYTLTNFDSGWYEVKVRGVASNGSFGPWSGFTEFYVNPVNIGVPTIKTPTEGQLFRNLPRVAYVSWDAPLNSTNLVAKYIVCLERLVDGTSNNWVVESTKYTTNKNLNVVALRDAEYRVHVRAIGANDQFVGGWSAFRNFTFIASTTPVVGKPIITFPTEWKEFVGVPQGVYVSWTAPENAQNIAKYTILCQKYNGPVSPAYQWSDNASCSLLSGTVNKYQVINVNSAGEYRINVRALDSNNNLVGQVSDYRQFVVKVANSPVVGTPSIWSPSQNQVLNRNTVKIQWDAGINNPRFRLTVDKFVSNDLYDRILDKELVGIKYYNVKLTSNSSYRVRVKGIANDGTQGDWSQYVNFSSPVINNVTSAPVITSPYNYQNIDNSKFTFTWNAVTNATKYHVEIEKSSGGEWRSWATFSALTDRSVVVTDMPRGFKYRVNVRGIGTAVNGSYGPWSDYVNFYVTPETTQPVVRANEIYFISKYFGNGLNAVATESATFSLRVTGDDNKGYNFVTRTFTQNSGGAFYVTADQNDGDLAKIWGNYAGQGGAVNLGNVSMDSAVPPANKTLYNKMGVRINLNDVYAIYDEANDKFALVKPLYAGADVDLDYMFPLDDNDPAEIVDINLVTASVQYMKKISTGQTGFQLNYTLDNLSDSTQKVTTNVQCLITTFDGQNSVDDVKYSNTFDLPVGRKSFNVFQPLTAEQVVAVNNLRNSNWGVMCYFKTGRIVDPATGTITLDDDLTNNVISIDLEWKLGRLRQNTFSREVEYSL